jgi:hypothetical protein
MSLVTSFLVMLQPLAVAMTAPTFCNWTTLLAGWAFAPRRTVTGMLLAAGAVGKKHHSAFHRLFAQAQWSLDQVGLLVFDMLARWLEGDVFVALDDTLARKRGLKVFGVIADTARSNVPGIPPKSMLPSPTCWPRSDATQSANGFCHSHSPAQEAEKSPKPWKTSRH